MISLDKYIIKLANIPISYLTSHIRLTHFVFSWPVFAFVLNTGTKTKNYLFFQKCPSELGKKHCCYYCYYYFNYKSKEQDSIQDQSITLNEIIGNLLPFFRLWTCYSYNMNVNIAT